MHQALPALHSGFVDAARAEVERDGRLIALLAGGSYVHGGFDRHSDLDLVIVSDDDAYDEVLAGRQAFAVRLGGLLAAFTGEHVGEPRLLICLYGPALLHVDLKFVTADDLDHRVERPAVLFARDPQSIGARLDRARIAWPERAPEWFEQRAWIWLHYAAAKLGRGELFEAIGMLAFFREQVLGPMLQRRAGRPMRGVRRLERHDPAGSTRLEATVATHDAAALRTAVLSAMDLYVELRADAPPAHPVAGMPEGIRRYIEAG